MTSRERIELRVEILQFFASNPYTMDTASGIAMRVGRPAEAVRDELERLVLLGILRKEGVDADAIYCYVRPDVGSGE